MPAGFVSNQSEYQSEVKLHIWGLMSGVALCMHAHVMFHIENTIWLKSLCIVAMAVVFCGNHKYRLLPGGEGEKLSSKEEYFDCSCFWSPGIGVASDPHLSTCPGAVDFFRVCNALRFTKLAN